MASIVSEFSILDAFRSLSLRGKDNIQTHQTILKASCRTSERNCVDNSKSGSKLNQPDEVVAFGVAPRGAGCSKEGNRYEKQVHGIVNRCLWKESLQPVNKQTTHQLGGSSNKHDLECVYGDRVVPIEVKKCKAPDWGQMSLKYDSCTRLWKISSLGTVNDNNLKQEIDNLILEYQKQTPFFNGYIPSFTIKDITHDEWKQEKKSRCLKDIYIECPYSHIARFYAEKGCDYIQVSDYGIYHTGVDTCNLNVHFFQCNQRIRIRTKIHTRKNSKGFCKISLMLSLQPNITTLQRSQHSLDHEDKLPHGLVYKNINV